MASGIPIPNVPSRAAFKFLGTVIVPGVLVQGALLALLDSCHGAGLLDSWLHPVSIASSLGWIISLVVLGLLWSALLNLLEGKVLDHFTCRAQKDRLDEVRESAGAAEHAALPDRELYDEIWEHYIERIESFPNRHLENLVGFFVWEWNVGSALVLTSIAGLCSRGTVLSAFHLPYWQDSLVSSACWLTLVIGLVMTLLIAPWTHRSLANLRTRMVKAHWEQSSA